MALEEGELLAANREQPTECLRAKEEQRGSSRIKKRVGFLMKPGKAGNSSRPLNMCVWSCVTDMCRRHVCVDVVVVCACRTWCAKVDGKEHY